MGRAHTLGTVPPAVTVVVPVLNDAEGLPRVVASVLDQEVQGFLEVLLCVGPSDDGTREVAERLAAECGPVRVLTNPGGTIPAALNLGLAAASGDVLVRVDARTVLPAGYVATAIETLESTGAANVGAIQHPHGHGLMQVAIAAAMRHFLGSGGASYRREAAPRHVDTGFLGVFEVERLRTVGGWDERFLRNEDAELNLRLATLGGVWLDPRLVVRYEPRSSLRGLARQYFDYGWWRRVTMRKHRNSIALRQAAAPLLVMTLLSSMLATLIWPWALLVVVGYVAVLVAGSLLGGSSDANPLLVAAAMGVMHLSWGSGFLASSLFGPRIAGDGDLASS